MTGFKSKRQMAKAKLDDDDEPLYLCPDCGSEHVTTEHHQTFMVNTGEHYCHSMKTQDSDSPAGCLDCDWRGQRKDFTEKNT